VDYLGEKSGVGERGGRWIGGVYSVEGQGLLGVRARSWVSMGGGISIVVERRWMWTGGSIRATQWDVRDNSRLVDHLRGQFMTTT
jgi:hypothetical protein